MTHFTHRQYFRQFQLNVAQYGEILVSAAFRGKKLGDGQPGYDILTKKEDFLEALRESEVITDELVLPHTDDEIRIQVKSKLSEAPTGDATVVHCSDSCIKHMTHLIVVLIHPGSRRRGVESTHEGTIIRAWLMTCERATELRKKKGKHQYISVTDLRSCADPVDISRMLSRIVDSPISSVESSPEVLPSNPNG